MQVCQMSKARFFQLSKAVAYEKNKMIQKYYKRRYGEFRLIQSDVHESLHFRVDLLPELPQMISPWDLKIAPM